MKQIPEFDLLNIALRGTNLIEASAGTGKTYAITGLVLRLILEERLPIDQILVVTFTEAATCELKERIRTRLREGVAAFSGGEGARGDKFLETLAGRSEDAGAARDRLNQAINDFDTAAIFTIHGFCMRVLRDHSFASGMLFDTELATEEDALLLEIARDFWRERFYAAGSLFLTHAAARRLSADAFFSTLKDGLSHPGLKIIPEADVPDCRAQEKEFTDFFERVCEAWPGARDDVSALLLGASGLNRTKYRKDAIPGWIESMDATLRPEGLDCPPCEWFGKFTSESLLGATKKNCRPPEHPFFDLCQGLQEARGRLEAVHDARVLGLKAALFDYARRELDGRKRDKNIFFYGDLLAGLDRALRGPSGESLARVVRERYKAALIDEFQDTDSLQYAIFEKTFHGREGSLFFIGDPKQAIYSFRGADIFTYMKAQERADSKFTLSENWRSEPTLIDAVNALFSNVENPFIHEKIAFAPARPPAEKVHEFLTIGGEPAEPLRLWFLNSDKVSGGRPIPKAKAEGLIATALAAEISRLLALGREGKALIGRRPVTEGDIAILVRTNYEAAPIRRALSELGVHAVLYNLGNLFESHEAMEMERFLTAVSNPTAEGALRAALATDMLGHTGEELEALLSDESAWDDWTGKFSEYRELWERSGFFRMFRSFLARESVLSRLMAPSDGERRCTNILHLSEVLHQAEAEAAHATAPGLLKWLAARRCETGSGIEEHQLRLESDENAVRIVTVHKSKGLEYPIVFCPYAWSRPGRKDGPVVFHDESGGRGPTLDLGSPRIEANRKAAEKEELAENLRLFYVAVTRARNRCCLVWGRFKGAGASAPAFLLHPSLSKGGDSDPRALETAFDALGDEDLWRDLLALREKAGGSIGLSEAPPGPGEPLPPAPGEAAELARRTFSGAINRDWRISSFSSLVSNQPRKAETADRDEALIGGADHEARGAGDAEGIEGQGAAPATEDFPPDFFYFPKGAAAGIFVHEVFERLDFQTEGGESLNSPVSEKLREKAFDPRWLGPVCEMVGKVLRAPLASPFDRFSLSAISPRERLSELEFCFPLRPTGERELEALLARCVGGAGSAGRASNMERLELKPAEGFMKGFIDLVVGHNGRFYILDWKSNHLGYSPGDYNREALQKEIEANFYNLQYTIYTLALHRYLRGRVPGYAYESHFGGVFYIFLRGVDAAEAPGCGIYYDRPEERSISELSSTLAGER